MHIYEGELKHKNNIDVFSGGKIFCDLSSFGWEGHKYIAKLNNEEIGYLNFSYINEDNFDKNYDIFSFLELQKNVNINYHTKKEISLNFLYELNNHLKVFRNKSFLKKLPEEFIPEVFQTLKELALKKYSDEYLEFKEKNINKAVVDYISVDEKHRGKGIAEMLYKASAMTCSKNNICLQMSYAQEDSAKRCWQKMIKNPDIPTVFDKSLKTYYIDYKQKLYSENSNSLIAYRDSIVSLGYSEGISNKATLEWAKKKSEFGLLYKEDFSSDINNEKFNIYKINPFDSKKRNFMINLTKSDFKTIEKINKDVNSLNNKRFKYS